MFVSANRGIDNYVTYKLKEENSKFCYYYKPTEFSTILYIKKNYL